VNHEQEDNFELSDLSLEIAAAELSVALAETDAQAAMPASLRSKLEELAAAHIAAMRARSDETSPVAMSGAMRISRIPSLPAAIAPTSSASAASSALALIPTPWQPFIRTLSAFAAAACILIGAGIFYYSISHSPSAKRDALVAKANTTDGVVRWDWVPWTSEADSRAVKASGDVVWDTQAQGGFMTFAGLPPIDASKEVYQLWIIDADRPGEHPVDGGTFTVDASGKVIVPFYARVKVGKPVAFAVTIERPGGVVVSDQKRKLTIAVPVKS
jgi:hypothetical protein